MRRLLLVILVAVLLAGGVVYALFARDMIDSRGLLAGRSQTIETSYGTLEYAETGKGQPVLAIHGTGGGFDQGLEMVGALASSHRLIAPSRFGYLGSAYPDGVTTAMQADAFVQLLDALAIDRAYIFGGSAGALSALQLAIRHPDRCRALVLLVPAAYAPTRKPNTSGAEGPVMVALVKAILGSDFVFWSLLKLVPDAMTTMLLATDPALVHAAEPADQARVRRVLDHILPVSVRSKGLMFDMKTAGDPEPMALDRITCPVLTVSARDDMFGTADPAEYIATSVPDGRAVIYPTGGHLWVGHEQDVWREVGAFLAAVELPPPSETAIP